MRNNNFALLVLILFLLFACKQQPDQQNGFVSNAPEIVTARGYVIPADSISLPSVIPAHNVTSRQAGIPKVVPLKSNSYLIGNPKTVKIGTPIIVTPGQDGFKLPQVSKATESLYRAGLPEIVNAKDAFAKDVDPENFSSFKSLQGLRQPLIRCMIQDNIGNLWFGTYSGGVSKYDGKYFSNYTSAQGLSNDGVWSMIQDKTGNIWMGTYGGGVLKYDGKYFTNFKTKQGLCDDAVFSIIQDKDGSFWFGTKGGVSHYNGKTFVNYSSSQGLANNFVHSIMQDKENKIWIGTGGGVSRFDGKTFTNYTTTQGLVNNVVNVIYQDRKGNIWLGTDGGISKFDEKYFVNYTVADGLSNNIIYSIYEDKGGNIWLATFGGGINKFDGKSFTHFAVEQGLSNNKTTSILEDKSGILWFGTNGGGVCRYDGRLFTHYTTAQGLCFNEVMRSVEDSIGNLWFGTWGGGVSKYDGKSFANFDTTQGLKNNNVFSVLLDSKGNLWFGTGNGVSKYDGKSFTNYGTEQGLSNDQVWSIYEDKNGNLWFGTFGAGVIKFDGKYFTHYTVKEGLPSGIVMTTLQDRNGDYWFGTYGGGLSKYDGKSFTHFTTKEGLSNNEVMDMMQDKNGNIWIGTIGGGVNKYDGRTFTHYSTAQGLSNEIIMGIIQDKSGDLWFSTRNGLNRMIGVFSNDSNSMSNEKPLFKNYLFADGFLGVNCYVNAIFEDSKRNIWLGTGDRLTCYHPGGEIPDTIPPSIQISNVSLYNEKINWLYLSDKKDTTLILGNGVHVSNFKFDDLSKWYNVPRNLSLAYNNNNLTFRFVGIATRSSYNVKYKYKLDGLDENWSAITDRNEAPYGNIPNGTYTFKVKAMNSEGYWSNEIKYTFSIRPPWWKTWWFRILAAAAVAAAVYSVYRYRLNQVLRLQNIRNKIAHDLHDDIGSTLNSISVYSEIAKQESSQQKNALEMIGESSRQVIDSMSDIVWAINSDNDSFEKIILRMRSMSYNLLHAKNIEHIFKADEALNEQKLSIEARRNFYLIFKEALNNLVKYSEATKAEIVLKKNNTNILLIIKDNGKGFDVNSEYNGNGLISMKQRAKEMKATININSDHINGTIVELLLKSA